MTEKLIDESKIMLRMSDFTSEPKRMLPPIKGYENQPLLTLEQTVEPLISLVPDIQQMVWTVKQNCENPQDDLTSDESGAIILYTLAWDPPELSFYFILNSTLRSQNRQELRPWFLYLRLVIYALAKLPPIPCRTIYRGVQVDMSQDFIKDKTFIWWSFSSCTSTLDVIKDFLGNRGPRTIINIESDSARDISRHSFYERESEILLYPARQFKVISSLDAGNQLHIIQLKEIQPPFSLIHIPQITSGITPTISMIPIDNVYQSQRLKDLIDFIEKCQHHSAVDLGGQQLTDEDMNIVVEEAIINKQCETLLLNANMITSAGILIITKALNKNTTLTLLMLSYNRAVGDMGVDFLTQTLSLNQSSLQELFLEDTGITDKGAGYLAAMLKTNSTLYCLLLCDNNISDRGVGLLATALTYLNRTFRHLDLSGNKSIGDSSIGCLTTMLTHNRSLSRLCLSNCNLSEKGKDRLQQVAQTKQRFTLLL